MSTARAVAAAVVVGTGPLSVADVVAVARTTRGIMVSEERLGRGPAHPGPGRGAGRRPGAALRDLDRLRCAGHPAHPARAAHRAAAQPGPLARRRVRSRGRARGGPGARAAADLDAGHRTHRHPRGDAADLRGHAQRRHHAGRARVRQPRLLRRPGPAGPLRAGADRRGRRSATPTGDAGPDRRRLRRRRDHAGRPGREGGPRADQRHRRHARHAGARARRPAPAAARRRRHRRDERRGSARHRRRVRRRPPGAAAAPRPARLRGEPADDHGRQRDPRVSSRGRARTGRRAPASRTRTRCAARPRWPAARATRWTTPSGWPLVELGVGGRQPGGHPRRPGRVERQLPRRAGRVRAGLPGHRRRRPGEHRRAADRPVPRPGPERRAAALPGRRPGRRLRADDRPVHPGRDRLRAQAAGRAGLGRLDPQLGDAGGPRLDGLVGGAQAAPRGRRADPGAGGRAADRRPRPRAARPAAARRRPPRRRSPRCATPASPAPAPTAGSPPRSRSPYGSSPTAASSPPSSPSPAPSPDPRRTRPTPRRSTTMEGARPVRAPRGTHPDGPVLDHRGAAADADEQPRPRERRAARRPRRLRRHRPRGPGLALVRRHDPDADHARAGRDHARPVGPAGRGDADPRVGAAGDPRQLQPRRRLGDLAGVPAAGAARPDHVRADDRRLVDLHRHPGHRPGDVRDLRRGRGEAVRRHARRHPHPDRRLRRHGRRAAAGRDA